MAPYLMDNQDSVELPMLGDIKAGFPSPSEDFKQGKLDLMK